ncbi:MAG: cysteine desulfurase [Xanthobacteraceae bacterium]|nr:cysteine desulfurase [Xanthobacteraceae bacterium]
MSSSAEKHVARTRVYFDWNATTPMRPQAKAAMIKALEMAGNPSSIHAEGRAARRLVEEARTAVAHAVGATAANVIFSSGGTEANALALTPGLRREGEAVTRLVMSAIEHPSVLSGGRFAVEDIEVAPVTVDGVVDLARLQELLAGKPPALVSVMLANNETGAIQPISEVAGLVHAAHGVLHVDGVQALGKIDINFNELGADLLSLSAHKVGGAKGVGALVLSDRIAGLEPLIEGGGQEKGRRAGTENVVGIASFGAAVSAADDTRAASANRMRKLQEKLERGLLTISPQIRIISSGVRRLPNTTLFSAPGMKAETAVIAFDLEGMAVSSGSACSSGKVRPSHVLEAMGIPPALAQGAVRLSWGWDTAEAEVQYLLEAWKTLAGVLLKGADAVA